MRVKTDYIDYDKVDEKTRASMDRLFSAPRRGYWARKRAFDIIVSLIMLLLLVPLFIVVSIVIVIDDPHAGPIFKQQRVGRHGVEVSMYKFRTMVANAEQLKDRLRGQNEMDGPVFKIKDDPRITRVGKFLRTTSIDELPQLINVLRGDMSLVGPRPPLPDEVAQYDDYERLRLVVTPGLTCLWQISDNRNDIPFEEWVEMDIDYIEHRTAIGDMVIMFKTAMAMIGKEGR